MAGKLFLTFIQRFDVPNPILLKQGYNLGAADAESDTEFLANCYVDAGYLDILADTVNSQSIVVGRTGSGKTALLSRFKATAEHVRELAPETLSLNYITNSNVLQFFEEAGVHLDLYYKLLWEHIIAVELLKLKFDIYNESRQKDFLSFVGNLITRDKQKERALKYLQEWGSKFWEESEYRVKEFTRKLEDSLTAQAGVSSAASPLSLTLGGASSLSEEQRSEVVSHGRRVVNKVQIDDLHQIINLLKEDVFHDKQKRYYLIIDRLDENWVEDRVKLKLLRALVDAVRAFRQVQNVKVIVGLRYDLLHSVLSKTVSSGFQTEKYVSLYLPIKWSRRDLERILDERVQFMFKRQYSGQRVHLADILPTNQMLQRKPLDYILDRTFLRPREAILFMNECIRQSAGQSRVNTTSIRQAESAYSQKRLTSLLEEWSRHLPNLATALRILQKRHSPTTLKDFGTGEVDDLATLLCQVDHTDRLSDLANQLLHGVITSEGFLKEVICLLYFVGVVGVKPAGYLSRQWSFDGGSAQIEPHQLTDDSELHIQQAFWAALGVRTRDFRGDAA